MKSSQGATLLELTVTVTIIGLFAVAFGGLLRSISIGGSNIPRMDGILTQQQVLDEINTFLVQFSRDARRVSASNIESAGEKITLGSVTYEFQRTRGVIVRRDENGDKIVLRGIDPEKREEIFARKGDDAIVVTLPVRYLSQTGRGDQATERRTISFVVQGRIFPSPSP